MPPAEKARQVAFKKEMADEEARYQAACEARDAAWKRRRRSFGGGRIIMRRRCTKTDTSRRRSKALGASSLRGGGPISSSVPPMRSSGERPTKWQNQPRVSAGKRQIGTSSAARWRRRSTASALGRRRAPGSCWSGAAGILAPGEIISFSIVRFQFYALYLVVKYHHVYVMILYIYIYIYIL